VAVDVLSQEHIQTTAAQVVAVEDVQKVYISLQLLDQLILAQVVAVIVTMQFKVATQAAQALSF
jgi:hypothetical protein